MINSFMRLWRQAAANLPENQFHLRVNGSVIQFQKIPLDDTSVKPFLQTMLTNENKDTPHH